MTNESLRALCQQMAEQAYMNNLVAEKLVGVGILQRGELQKMYEADPQRRKDFFRDFLAQMVALGLQIDESEFPHKT